MGAVLPHSSLRLLAPLAFMALAASLVACDDGKKASEQDAVDSVQHLLTIVKEDVLQVRRGLPEGAAKLAPLLDADTIANPANLQRAIATARAAVPDLAVAKSTFFSYADANGTVLRSEGDPDLLARKALFPTFPTLKKAADAGSGIVEATGEMQEMRAAKTGNDLAWVVAHPVKDGSGVKGLFVTGWSYRGLAYHLDDAAKRAFTEDAKKAGKKNPPFGYVFVVKGQKAYGAPTAAPVNVETIEKLDVLEKTKGGVYRGNVEITNRVFGVAAARAPELGDDAAIAVLASEF